MIYGDVGGFLRGLVFFDVDWMWKIGGQDIFWYWKVVLAVFFGLKVNGNMQWGKIGMKMMLVIFLMLGGIFCLDFGLVIGEGLNGWGKDLVMKVKYNVMILNYGDVCVIVFGFCGIVKKYQMGCSD